jgi:hypothetical protein
MLNLIKYVKYMKKLLFFAVLALFMCSCEEKTGYGCIDIYNRTGKSLFIDVYDMSGELCHQRVANGTYIYMIMPTGKYKVKGTIYMPYYEQERICVVPDNDEVALYFYY